MDKERLPTLLKKYHLKPNFTYGQNFLIDDNILTDIIAAAEILPNDAILEIGPGIGNLTELLLERAAFVLSIEKDPKFLPILKTIKKKYPKNFRYEIADALEFDFQSVMQQVQYSPPHRGTHLSPGENGVIAKEEYPRHGGGEVVHQIYLPPRPLTRPPLLFLEGNAAPGYKVVANIPYFITGKILRMLLSARSKPESITLLTQKEVAQNIVSGPGKLSILAISVQLFGQPKIVRQVPRESFYPAPKVDSALLQIVPYIKNPYGIFNEKKFFSVLRACFAGKRKQIHNSLVNNLHLSADATERILQEIKINPTVRPQELSIEEWIELSDKIKG